MGSRNERPHAYHLRFQFFKRSNVVQQAIPCLTGRPHHHAGSSLIPQSFQRPQAFPTPCTVHLTWMQKGIMRLIPCFVAKQVTIRPCITPAAVHLPVAFPHRQRDGMSGELRAEARPPILLSQSPILLPVSLRPARQKSRSRAVPPPGNNRVFAPETNGSARRNGWNGEARNNNSCCDTTKRFQRVRE